MKTTLFLALISFALSLAIAGTANNWIVGHWRYAKEGRSSDCTYRGDGTFTGNVALQGKVVWVFAGTWSIDGDMLNYQYTQSSVERIPVGTTGGDKLVEITSDHFTLETNNRTRQIYLRLP